MSRLITPFVTEEKALRFSTSLVKILIGRDEHERMFIIHESILTARSALFRVALPWRCERTTWERIHQDDYREEEERWVRNEEDRERAEELEREGCRKCFGDCEGAQREELSAQFEEEKESYEDWENTFSRKAQFAQEQQQNSVPWNYERYVWDANHYDVEQDAFRLECWSTRPRELASTFSIYQHFTHTGRVPDTSTSSTNRNEPQTSSPLDRQGRPTSDSCIADYRMLANLYILSNELQDTEAKNAAVVALISKCAHEATAGPTGANCLPEPSTLQLIYNASRGPTEHCAMRQALVDCFVYYGDSSQIRFYDDQVTTRLPYPFLIDLTEALMEYRTKPKHGLPHERLETYREDEMGWTRYKGELVMEADKIKEPVIDLLV